MSNQVEIPKTMRAWEVTTPGPIDGENAPLKLVTKPVPHARLVIC